MYQDEIKGLKPLRAESIVEICRKLIPSDYCRTPWRHPEVDHGRGILKTEDGMNCYMACYGSAHIAKAFQAIRMLDQSVFSKPFEIIDWGCGQGIASLCLIEHLRTSNQLNNLKCIQLIEPGIAISRAELNLSLAAPHIPIIKYQKGLPPVVELPFDCINKIDVKQTTVVHLFSNILDIQTIDLKELAKLVSSTGIKHIVSCFGPANCNEQRIDAFCRYFDTTATTFSQPYKNTELFHHPTYGGRTFGCYIRNFSFIRKEGKPVLIPYKFFPPKQFFAGYKSDLLEQITPEEVITKVHTAFEVIAPFDFGASVYEDVHPIWAVINNLIVRGLPTKTSPWIESLFEKEFNISEKNISLGTIKYNLKDGTIPTKDTIDLIRNIPLAVARLQKVIVEAVITGSLPIKKEWTVLVKEMDVPCAAIAFRELSTMFETLTSLSKDYMTLKFPTVKLNVINPKYASSTLHLDANVKSATDIPMLDREYDLVIDIAIKELCNPKDVEFSEFKARNNCYFNVRSSESVYGDRYIYTTNRIIYNTLTNLTVQGIHETIPEQADKLRYFLQLLFRKEDFREGQLPIISRALQLKSVIGLLPTGGGKSLTYQIASLLQPGVSIVVDPLVSLMKDQYDGLIKCGIDICTYINSTVANKTERENEMKESKQLFVFLSPERLAIFRFRQSLRSMQDNHVYFAYGVIDEVHCVSEWGHDFRFSYLHLGRNLYKYVLPKQTPNQEYNHITLMGLTATASFDVLADVERELSGNSAFPLDPQSTVRYENTNRLELQYRVIKVDDLEARDKWDIFAAKSCFVPDVVKNIFHQSLEELQHPDVIENIKNKFLERENIDRNSDYAKIIKGTGLNANVASDWYSDIENPASAIVFCPHRVGSIGVYPGVSPGISDQIEDALKIPVSRYCGGDELTAQDDFIQGKTNIMVATKAFGMGIDKPNVRFTLNVNHSGSLEAYVQEAGRAGRDRKMALSIILYSDHTFNEQDPNTRFIENIPVDFGVHKFFYDGNFIGSEFEKWVMYYLMTRQSASLAEIDDNTHMNKSVNGFLSKMQDANVGESIIAYISYQYPSQDSQTLDQLLIKSHLRPVGGNHKNLAEKQQRYYEALMKAIYRMCCIGLIDDYTQDYVREEFRIVTRKLAEGKYFDNLRTFLMRYFSEDRATLEVEKAKQYRGENEVQKCLGYLTDFIYKSIATKRKQAIYDIDSFCQSAITSSNSWLDVNEELKDYIYYYFNSKYARKGFIAPNDEPFSLVDDTQHGKLFDFGHVLKYMRVTDEDMIAPGGTPKDNVKHLLGAVRLTRRALTDSNPTLDFLNVFCLYYLQADKEGTPTRAELERSYIEGYIAYKERANSSTEFYNQISDFKVKMKDKKIVNDIQLNEIERFELIAEASIHAKWASKFSKQFTK